VFLVSFFACCLQNEKKLSVVLVKFSILFMRYMYILIEDWKIVLFE
jgi:hypothetical protein